MKSYTRVAFECVKTLPNGILEHFRVCCLANQAQEIKAQYEARGYTVAAAWL